MRACAVKLQAIFELLTVGFLQVIVKPYESIIFIETTPTSWMI